MRIAVPFAVLLAALAPAAQAHAAWTAPVRVAAGEIRWASVAVNARGDAVVVWASPRGGGRTSLRVAVRSRTGRLTSRRIWSARGLAISGTSAAIDRRGEITVAWSANAGPRSRGDTVRARYRSRGGRWARPQLIGHRFDWPLPGDRPPRLAAAPDGRVLLAWDARSRPWTAPSIPTVAWRVPGHRFGTSQVLKGAPEELGPIPAFDAAGAAYVHGRCDGSVLRTRPGSRRFLEPVVLAGNVLGFDLSLGKPGEGLATWVDGWCTTDPAAGNLPGPVRAGVLHEGRFGAPLGLTDPGAQEGTTTAAALPAGGGIASWAAAYEPGDLFSVPVGPDGTLGAGPVAGGPIPLTVTASGDTFLVGQTTSSATYVQGGIQVRPSGSGAPEAAPSDWGDLAVAAPTGRAAALAWGSVRTLRLSVWRPEPAAQNSNG